ncbi:MAG: hypothetical protein ACREVJ_02945 [Gammaproteobacteria bacterium]
MDIRIGVRPSGGHYQRALWLEATYAFGGLDEDKIDERFGAKPQAQQDEPSAK